MEILLYESPLPSEVRTRFSAWRKEALNKTNFQMTRSVQEFLFAQGTSTIISWTQQPSTSLWWDLLWSAEEIPGWMSVCLSVIKRGKERKKERRKERKEREKEIKKEKLLIVYLAASIWKSFCILVYYKWLKLMELRWCRIMRPGIFY